jgi:hypothetical protein
VTRLTIAQAAEYHDCHEEVTRRGEFQPCERPAVGLRLDQGGPYPVCRTHVRHPMVKLADVYAAIKGVLS